MDMFELKKRIENRTWKKNTLLIAIPEETDIEFIRKNIAEFISTVGLFIKINPLPISAIIANDKIYYTIIICDPERLAEHDYIESFITKATYSYNIQAIWELPLI